MVMWADMTANIYGSSEFIDYDDIDDYYHEDDQSAYMDVIFEDKDSSSQTHKAVHQIEQIVGDRGLVAGSAVSDTNLGPTINKEVARVMVLAVIIIYIILTITTTSWFEPVMFRSVLGIAIIINMGSNIILGEISFLSNAVGAVLQLACSMDYSIFLLHSFTQERAQGIEPEQAMANAWRSAFSSIFASGMTTIVGFAAMCLMNFGIGPDMAMVLIKAICFSMLSVFTLMPGLLMLFANALVRTQHREFLPKIDKWGRLVVKLRYIGVPVFLVVLVAGFILANRRPYVYGDTLVKTTSHSEQQIADHRVDDTFGAQNVAAVLVPRGDYEKEKRLLDRLERYDQVDSATGLANIEAKDGYCLTDKMTPRQFSEMTDVSYESVCLLYSAYAVDQEEYGRIVGGIENYSVPLMDMFIFLHDQMDEGYVSLDDETEADVNDMYDQLIDGQKQMLGENYSRLVLNLDLPEEGQETFDFLKTIHQEAERYYPADQVLVVGNATSNYDLSTSFARDNVMISVLSVAFVILILLFTFQSVGLPILLILVIQGSIWINFSFPTLTNTNIYFMSYLVVTAIQMGANIDYAIVISTRYTEMKASFPPKTAIVKALNLAFPTVFTSGTILSSAAFLIGKISTEVAIVGIGECISRGTLISMFLVMFILPQILLVGDIIVEKTSFKLKAPVPAQRTAGTVYVNGRVRGRINGVVDANVHGVVHGEISALVGSGTIEKLPEEDPSDDDQAQDEETNGK